FLLQEMKFVLNMKGWRWVVGGYRNSSPGPPPRAGVCGAALDAPVANSEAVLRVFGTAPSRGSPDHREGWSIGDTCHFVDRPNDDGRKEPIDLVIGDIDGEVLVALRADMANSLAFEINHDLNGACTATGRAIANKEK